MKPILTREEAAAARLASVATRGLAPASRRCAEAIDSKARVTYHSDMKLRAASLKACPTGCLDCAAGCGDQCKCDATGSCVACTDAGCECIGDTGDGSSFLVFDGVASAYEQAYTMWDYFGPYDEIVTAGAGAASLNRVDLEVPYVHGHDQMRRIASTWNDTLFLSESDIGLIVNAPQLDPEDYDVAYMAPKMRAGLYNEMSFAFRITQGIWSPDYTQYRINTYDIHRGDVSIVGFGANPYTTGSLRADRDLRALLRDAPEDEARSALGELLQRFPAKRKRAAEEPLLPLRI